MSYGQPPNALPPNPPGYGSPPMAPPGDAPPGYPPPGYGPPPGGGYPPQGMPPVDHGPRQYNMSMGYVLFWSPKLWRDVGLRWRGIGLTYMLLLMLVTWGIDFAAAYPGYANFVENEAPKVINQVPP